MKQRVNIEGYYQSIYQVNIEWYILVRCTDATKYRGDLLVGAVAAHARNNIARLQNNETLNL